MLIHHFTLTYRCDFRGTLGHFQGRYTMYTSVYRSISDTRPVHNGTNREALAK